MFLNINLDYGLRPQDLISLLSGMIHKIKEGWPTTLKVGSFEATVNDPASQFEGFILKFEAYEITVTVDSFPDVLAREYDRAELGLIPKVFGPEPVVLLDAASKHQYQEAYKERARLADEAKAAALARQHEREQAFQHRIDKLASMHITNEQEYWDYVGQLQDLKKNQKVEFQRQAMQLANNWACLMQTMPHIMQSGAGDNERLFDDIDSALEQAWLTTPSRELIERALGNLNKFWQHSSRLQTWIILHDYNV